MLICSKLTISLGKKDLEKKKRVVEGGKNIKGHQSHQGKGQNAWLGLYHYSNRTGLRQVKNIIRRETKIQRSKTTPEGNLP